MKGLREMKNVNLIDKLKVENKYQFNVALPNELFTLLNEWKEDDEITSTHIPFVYSYLYFITYMYRYGKYSNWCPSVEEIKEVLGVSKISKHHNYIIKKNGVLDTKNLTLTTNNLSIGYTWFDESVNNKEKLDRVKVETLNDSGIDIKQFKEFHSITNRYTIKLPKFAYYRDVNEYNDKHINCDGTFYESENTTMLDIRVFNFCMSKDDLGCTAFYLYAYLKHKNDLFGGYDASHIRLANELGLSDATIKKYRDALRSYNMVYLKHNMEYFSPTMDNDKRKVSTNITNNFEIFNSEPMEFNKFKRVKDKTSQYDSNLDYTEQFKETKGIDIDENCLPF